MAPSASSSDDTSSDYGSDFSAGEEALVKDLIARAERQASQPPPLALTDLEDDERPRHLHLPRDRASDAAKRDENSPPAQAAGGPPGEPLLAVRVDGRRESDNDGGTATAPDPPRVCRHPRARGCSLLTHLRDRSRPNRSPRRLSQPKARSRYLPTPRLPHPPKLLPPTSLLPTRARTMTSLPSYPRSSRSTTTHARH